MIQRMYLMRVIYLATLMVFVIGKDSATCDEVDGVCVNDVKVPKFANPDGKPREATSACLDRHDQCATFASAGECDRNPGWMIVNCPLSCNACHLRDAKIRCTREALNISSTPIYQPGDMNDMFESIQERFGDQYNIQILSTDPWVVTFDNFVKDEEIDALINSVDMWERSTDVGDVNEFGEAGRILSTGRTSSNSWCIGECEENEYVQNLMSRIEEVTYVPTTFYESLQILRYEIGQKYDVHHDSSEDDYDLACGPRILTFFLYLSDVEEGGETWFPQLKIDVKPKKGKALLWPSVLDHDPEAIDTRTTHAAKPVIKGKKYAANAWIHSHDFMTPNLWGCTGSFDDL